MGHVDPPPVAMKALELLGLSPLAGLLAATGKEPVF
jgi:hypothetical protein